MPKLIVPQVLCFNMYPCKFPPSSTFLFEAGRFYFRMYFQLRGLLGFRDPLHVFPFMARTESLKGGQGFLVLRKRFQKVIGDFQRNDF